MTAHRPRARRVALVTGATDGLGRILALTLARQDWQVIIHGRDEGRCRDTALAVEQACGHMPAYHCADFSSLRETLAFADAVGRTAQRLDLLVNNAGLGIGKHRVVTGDGLELVFQVNCVAGSLLTRHLLPLLAASAPARVLNISSAGQFPIDFSDIRMEKRWRGGIAYGRSKLAQIMDVRTLAERYPAGQITFQAIHPASLMRTKLVTAMPRPASRFKRFIFDRLMAPRNEVEAGLASVMKLLDAEELRFESGRYFNFTGAARVHRQADDIRARAALDEFIEEIFAGQADQAGMEAA